MARLNASVSNFTLFLKLNNFSTGCSVYTVFNYSKAFYYFLFYLNTIFLQISRVKKCAFYENPYIKIRLKLANLKKF